MNYMVSDCMICIRQVHLWIEGRKRILTLGVLVPSAWFEPLRLPVVSAIQNTASYYKTKAGQMQ